MGLAYLLILFGGPLLIIEELFSDILPVFAMPVFLAKGAIDLIIETFFQ